MPSCVSMTDLFSGVQKSCCRFAKFSSLSSQWCATRPRCSSWPKSSRQRKALRLAETHWRVSLPMKMGCQPAPTRRQQSHWQGRGRACGPGLVLLAIWARRNRSGKGLGPFAVRAIQHRNCTNGLAPSHGGASHDVATWWCSGHAHSPGRAIAPGRAGWAAGMAWHAHVHHRLPAPRLLRMLRAVPTRYCSAYAPPPGHAGNF